MSAISLLTRSRLRRGWLGLASVAILAGIVGGLATATIAGERRGATAGLRLIEETRAPEVTVGVNSVEPADIDEVLAAIDSQPGVARSWPASIFIGRTTVAKDWYYPIAGDVRPSELYRPKLDEGRFPRDDAVDELMITRQTSNNTGLQVGDDFEFDLYSTEQFFTVNDDSEIPPDGGRLRMRVVGILRDASDIAVGRTEYIMVGSPALNDRYDGIGRLVLVKLDEGTTAAAFEEGLRDSIDPNLLDIAPLDDDLAAAKPSLQVIQVALWAMAAVIALTGIVVVNQVIRRRLAEATAADHTLKAIGLDRQQRVWAGTLLGAPAAMASAAICVVVAVLVSPVFPVGGPRSIEPSLGFDVAFAALAIGALVTMVVVAALFLVGSLSSVSSRPAVPPGHPSTAMTTVNQVVPVAVALGISLIGDRGIDRNARSTTRGMIAIAMGVAGFVASATWVASLDRLTTTSAGYGVPYDLSVEVPKAEIAQRNAELAADERIDVVAQVANAPIEIGSKFTSGTALTFDKGTLQPQVLEGRLPAATTEVALGPGLVDDLNAGVGSQIDITTGDAKVTVDIVGVALDPRVTAEDYAGGVLMTTELLDKAAIESPYVLTALRYKPEVDVAETNAALDKRYPWGVIDESLPAPPSPILNLDGVRVVPVFLGWFFVGVAVISLFSTVLAAARRHNRSLAVVRSLGLRPTQLRITLCSLALSVALLAVAIGIPAGMVLGNLIWSAVARSVDVQSVVRWPTTMIGATVAVLTVAALVATIWPAHRLLRRPPSAVLGAE